LKWKRVSVRAGPRSDWRHGATDEYCYNIVKGPVHINDMNATILHCMGIDHERFTFKFQGLNVRLTGVVEAHAIKQILA
jgi:hypothetical protein